MPEIKISDNEMNKIREKGLHYNLNYERSKKGYTINANISEIKNLKKELGVDK